MSRSLSVILLLVALLAIASRVRAADPPPDKVKAFNSHVARAMAAKEAGQLEDAVKQPGWLTGHAAMQA